MYSSVICISFVSVVALVVGLVSSGRIVGLATAGAPGVAVLSSVTCISFVSVVALVVGLVWHNT